MVNYYSNFIEISPLQNDNKTSTILKHMKANIARYGIMDTYISDNGPQFGSYKFKHFVFKNEKKNIFWLTFVDRWRLGIDTGGNNRIFCQKICQGLNFPFET